MMYRRRWEDETRVFDVDLLAPEPPPEPPLVLLPTGAELIAAADASAVVTGLRRLVMSPGGGKEPEDERIAV